MFDRRLFAAVDMGSAMVKASLVGPGPEGALVFARGSSPVFGRSDAPLALREALAFDTPSARPTPDVRPPRGRVLAVASSRGGPLRVLVLGWKEAPARAIAAASTAGAGVFGFTTVSADGRPRSPVCDALYAGCVLCVGPPGPGFFDPEWFLRFLDLAPRVPVFYHGGPGGLGFLKGWLGGTRIREIRGDESDHSLFRETFERTLAAHASEILDRARGAAPALDAWRMASPVPVTAAAARGTGLLVTGSRNRAIYVDAGFSMTLVAEASHCKSGADPRPVSPAMRRTRSRPAQGAGPGGFESRVFVGRGIGSFAEAASLEETAPLGETASLGETAPDGPCLADWAAARSARPWLVPDTRDALESEGILVRRCVRSAMAESGIALFCGPEEEAFVVAGGSLRYWPSWTDRIGPILGSLGIKGWFRLAIDAGDSIVQSGALAESGIDLDLAQAGLVVLGDCIRPLGRASEKGEPCLEVEAGEAGSFRLEWGSLLLVPVPTGSLARVRVKPLGSADVGCGPGETVESTVRGGSLGFIVDAGVDRHDA